MGRNTLDTHSSNSSKGNKDISEKLDKYFNESNFRSQYKLASYVNPLNSEWSISSIKNRRNEIVNFVIDRWNPKKITGTKPYNILDLTFMENILPAVYEIFPNTVLESCNITLNKKNIINIIGD